jgi:glycosyltransferase involved in cell wall biosynthesis
MMKILCVTPDDLSTLIFCKTLSRLLAEKNIDFITVSGNVEGLGLEMYDKEVKKDIISKHISLPMKRFISPLHDIRYIVRLFGIIKKEKPSSVITFTTKPNIYGQVAALLAGVPLRVMAVRGLGRTFNDPRTYQERILKSVMTALYKISCKFSSRVWFTNPSDLSDFVSSNICSESKTFITKNAVDLKDFCLDNIDRLKLDSLRDEFGILKTDKIVIMVARLIEQKGIKEYARAAELLYTRYPQINFFLIAPEEPNNPSMVPVSFIREMEAKSNLKWLGFRKDVRELYALSDLAVLPSYYKEGGYPRALLEGMAYGKPVIAADTPDCKGPVVDGLNGYLVPPRDFLALGNAIEKILTDDDLQKQMGTYSLKLMKEEFDDTQVFTSVIDKVLLT